MPEPRTLHRICSLKSVEAHFNLENVTVKNITSLSKKKKKKWERRWSYYLLAHLGCNQSTRSLLSKSTISLFSFLLLILCWWILVSSKLQTKWTEKVTYCTKHPQNTHSVLATNPPQIGELLIYIFKHGLQVSQRG